MAISDILDDAKGYLDQIKKKYRFKKANLAREKHAELQAALLKCRGKLEICQKDFNRTIVTQSKNISEGMSIGADTAIQEDMLWDAAIGYMLVRDAIFSLKTINSYDSVAHAYDMLDAAIKQMKTKKDTIPFFPQFGSSKERNAYGYINSPTAVKAKEELLETFFDKLKINGDIEGCLAAARHPADQRAEVRHSYTKEQPAPVSEMDAMMAEINHAPSSNIPADDFENGISSARDIHPPKDPT